MTTLRRAYAAAALVPLLVLAGCGGGSSGSSGSGSGDASTKPDTSASSDASSSAPDEVVEVSASGETQPMTHGGDSADDPAIWVDRQDPAKSLVIGNDKQGALETYDLDGTLHQRIQADTTFWGNVDVRQGVELGGRTVDVVAVANAGIRLFTVDPKTRRLVPATAGGKSLDTGGGEGLCLFHSPAGELSVFMVNISGNTRQFALTDDGTGHLAAKQVRDFKVGSEAEGCVVDDENQALYLDEENVGTWKYAADPAGGEQRTMLDPVKPKGHQIADIEGITLVDDGGGKGLLIASSQGQADEASYFTTYDRRSGKYLSSFRIVDGEKADGCSHTDGIAATSAPLGPDFPHGLFVCQDDDNTAPGTSGHQDFKLTRLETIRP